MVSCEAAQTGMDTRRIWRFPAPAHTSTPLPKQALRGGCVNTEVWEFPHADYVQRGAPLRVAIFNRRIELAPCAVKMLDRYSAIYHDNQRYM